MVYPSNLQGVLWSKDISTLNLDRDKGYIIHQILAYGTWEHVKWLYGIYNQEKIKDVFINQPSKDYTERSFNFVQKILLNIPDGDINKKLYVKSYPRTVG